VLSTLRERSLARLRKQVEPVDAGALCRFVATWQGVARRRAGLDALLDVVEQLQGRPVPASELEREILPARVEGLSARRPRPPRRRGRGRVGRPRAPRRSRRAHRPVSHRPPPPAAAAHATRLLRTDLEQRLIDHLQQHGASFFPSLHTGIGGGFPAEVVDALWSLVWRGLVTNDTLQALRAFVEPPKRARRPEPAPFRSRRVTPPEAQGRWSLVADRLRSRPSATEWATAAARQLLARHGVLTREAMNVEAIPGGYSAVYDVLRALEDAGRLRRGLFVGGLGAAQFALPPAIDLLRTLREPQETAMTLTLASADPAKPVRRNSAMARRAGGSRTRAHAIRRDARRAG
jgi:ATP-dependent Lhr-like helicase